MRMEEFQVIWGDKMTEVYINKPTENCGMHTVYLLVLVRKTSWKVTT